MQHENVTTDMAAALARLLKARTEPIVAADIAMALKLGGDRETQRRHVRRIVKHLRDGGSRIVATIAGGYWLTADDAMWKDYLEGRSIDAKRIIGEAAKRKRAIEPGGQQLLFMPGFRVGVA